MLEGAKWDERFLGLAEHISGWSKDPSTKVGAVLVRGDKTVVSVGFNGLPRSMRDDVSRYDDRNEKYSRIIHAEMNAVLHAGENLRGTTIYTYPLGPCDRCTVHLIQSGVQRFVFPKQDNERWVESILKSKSYITECGCTYEEY